MFKYILTTIALVASFSASAHYINIQHYKRMNGEQQLFFVMGVHDSVPNCTPDIKGGELLKKINELILQSPPEYNKYSAAKAVKDIMEVRFKCNNV